MAAKLQGRVTNISDEDLGSSLDGDHAAGATTIVVQNAADFDEDGGTLVINDQQIDYTSCDDDTDTITLAEGLAAAADDGDTVSVWDPLREVIAVDKMASVDVGDDYADDMEAVVALHLVDHLVEGPRGDDGESVVLELDEEDDEWKVVDILGLGGPESSGLRAEADDYYVLTAADITAGVATIPLSHRPVDEWLIAVLGGVPQRPTNYSIDYDAQKITWPLDGWEQAGVEIWVHYAYRKGVATSTAKLSVPLGDTWKLKFAASGPTSSTAEAQPGYDDSTWPEGVTPVGSGYPGELNNANGYVWLRKTVTTSGGDLLFKDIGPDDRGRYYLDGVLVWSASWPGAFTEQSKLVANVAAGQHTLAAYIWNEGTGGYRTSVQVYEQ